jgi:MbtH protein
MNRINKEESLLYRVLVNRDAELSIWPTGRDIPLGWMAVGITARRSECLAYINTIWSVKPPGFKNKKREVSH